MGSEMCIRDRSYGVPTAARGGNPDMLPVRKLFVGDTSHGFFSDPPESLHGIRNHVSAEHDHEDAEEEAKHRRGEPVRRQRPEPGTDDERGGDEQRGTDVDVVVPVVLQEGDETDRRQEHGQARADGPVHGKAHDVHQGGHDDDAAPDPEESREDTGAQADGEEEKDHFSTAHMEAPFRRRR